MVKKQRCRQVYEKIGNVNAVTCLDLNFVLKFCFFNFATKLETLKVVAKFSFLDFVTTLSLVFQVVLCNRAFAMVHLIDKNVSSLEKFFCSTFSSDGPSARQGDMVFHSFVRNFSEVIFSR